MATADELLNVVSDVDKTLVIDSDLRTIIIPKSITNLGVESDDDVLKLEFQMPKTYCGIDLSNFKIVIHYLNAQAEGDVYDVTDLRVYGDTLKFSWLVGRQVTMYKGNIAFNVCVREVYSDGTVNREFNTTPVTLPVLEGLETSKQAVAQYTNILEQWRERLFGTADSEEQKLLNVSATQQENITQRGAEVLATIPEDYTTTSQNAKEAIRTKGDAIVQSPQGIDLKIMDSSDDYFRNIKLFGKTEQLSTTGAQLLQVNDMESKTDRGLTQTISKGVCVVKGTATSTSAFNLTLAGSYYATEPFMTLPAGTYTLVDCMLVSYDGSTMSKIQEGTFTLTEEFGITWVATRSYAVDEVVSETLYPMLNKGSYALPFEPYTGGSPSPSPEYPQALSSAGVGNSTTLAIHDKNLLEPKSNSNGGYKATVNDDGSVTVTGSATTTNAIYLTIATPSEDKPLKLSKNKKYFSWANSSNGKYLGTKTLDNEGNPQWSTVSTWNKNVGTDYMNIVQIYCESNGHAIGDTSLCGTYRFQLELGDEFTGFEGYKPAQTLIYSDVTGIHGIPVESGGNYTDDNGQQWICDEVDFNEGVYVHRTKLINLASCENWQSWGVNYKTEGYTGFYHYWDGLGNDVTNAVCTIAPHKGDLWGGAGHGAYTTKAGRQYIAVCLPNSALADVSSKDAAIESFVNLCADTNAQLLVTYTPYETPLTSAELEMFKSLKTNYPTTTIINDTGICMEASYNADTKLYVDNAIMSAIQKLQNGIV